MKNWNLNRVNKSKLDKVNFIPRSINKIFEKLTKELDPYAENEALEEFKISKYHTVASFKYLLILIIVPIIANQVTKNFFLGPIIDYAWNIEDPNLFLNESQEERAFAELQRFEEKINFEILIGKLPPNTHKKMEEQMMRKAKTIAVKYANESVDAIKNIFSDIVSIITFLLILSITKRQISILKSFVNQLIYGLSDTAKAFLIILVTDIFVGFHSPHGWEVIIETMLRHLGLPESRDFIFIFIATFPVVLDTIFKYWIFRYLNKLAPSAVATYHSMNE
jgi:hypothetical protein